SSSSSGTFALVSPSVGTFTSTGFTAKFGSVVGGLASSDCGSTFPALFACNFTSASTLSFTGSGFIGVVAGSGIKISSGSVLTGCNVVSDTSIPSSQRPVLLPGSASHTFDIVSPTVGTFTTTGYTVTFGSTLAS